MKITAYIMAMVLSLGSCADHKTTSKVNNNINNQDITADNYIEAIVKKVKHYPQEPIYYLRIGKANCLIEILVNDFPVYESYELSNLATPLKINHAILKSGTQTITYKLYPLGDLIKEEYDYGETVTKLGNATRASISVTQWDNKSEDSADEELVHKHLSPTKSDNDDVFAGSELPYYEHTFTFQAQVPYEISGWSNGIDLSKVLQEQLENSIVSYSNKYLDAFRVKNIDRIARFNYRSFLSESIVYYYTEENVREIWENTLKAAESSKEIQPIKDYELVFYGEKKIAFLKQNTVEDIRLRNKSASWFLYKKENGKTFVRFLGIYLIVPKEKYNKDSLVLESF